jgi:hypothetical protein
LVSEEGTDIMNEQHAGAGWYADPAGRHEWRYFDGHWTDQVVTRGVGSTQALPVASTGSPAAWPADGAPGRKRAKLWALTAAGAAAATVAVVLAVHPSQGGSSFCADYAAVGAITTNASLADGGVATVRKLADSFQKLAVEAPATAKADLNLLANDMSTLGRTGTPSISDEAAQAAADRVDAVAQDTCNR